MTRLVILEGPDGGGKSTLASAIIDACEEDRGLRVVHHGPYIEDDNPFDRYLAPMYSVALTRTQAVFDRSWLSEPIYGRAYRNGLDRLGTQVRMLERLALGLGAVVINCTPAWETVKASFLSRRGDEYLDRLDQLRAVWEEYQDLDQTTDLDVLTYDRDVDDPRAFYFRHLHHLLEAPRAVSRITGNVPGARVLLVGERSNGRDELPFINTQGCSPWLAAQLARAGIAERDLAWVNAETRKGDDQLYLCLHTVRSLVNRGTRVVALGNVAARALRRHVVPHEQVPHPQHWKRFHHREEYPLLPLLKEVLS